MSTTREQLTFDHLLCAYADTPSGVLDNDALYKAIGDALDINEEVLNRLEPVGKDGRKYSKVKREIRWIQQSLKRAGLLEGTGDRAQWRLTREGKKKVELHKAVSGFSMLAFSTKLGIAIWGDAKDVFSKLNEPITLTVSSPPYPIRHGRAYGTWDENEIIDFIVGVLEPIVKNLVDGGSVMLNLGNDVFEYKSPARSIYVEKLIIRLYDTLGLKKMDTIIWHNPSKAPGPIEWASKQHIQMATAYEPIIWMCNNPVKAKTDNQRILQPISKEYQKLIDKGGENRVRSNGDGAHVVRQGNFSKQVKGALPRNVIKRGHTSKSSMEYRKLCMEHGLPIHGAMFPYELVKRLIEFGSEEGDLIVDPFGGSLTSALAAHELNRRFITTDIMHEYLMGGALRFNHDEVNINKAFQKIYTGYANAA